MSMTREQVEALQAKAANEGGVSQQESQDLYDHHQMEGLAKTIDLLWQAYDAAWHMPLHQTGHIQEALSDLLFEQALLSRKQQQK